MIDDMRNDIDRLIEVHCLSNRIRFLRLKIEFCSRFLTGADAEGVRELEQLSLNGLCEELFSKSC